MGLGRGVCERRGGGGEKGEGMRYKSCKPGIYFFFNVFDSFSSVKKSTTSGIGQNYNCIELILVKDEEEEEGIICIEVMNS